MLGHCSDRAAAPAVWSRHLHRQHLRTCTESASAQHATHTQAQQPFKAAQPHDTAVGKPGAATEGTHATGCMLHPSPLRCIVPTCVVLRRRARAAGACAHVTHVLHWRAQGQAKGNAGAWGERHTAILLRRDWLTQLASTQDRYRDSAVCDCVHAEPAYSTRGTCCVVHVHCVLAM